jgi:hypothetical protein
MPATNRALLLEFQTLFRGFMDSELSGKSLKELCNRLSKGNFCLYCICLELALQGNSLEPLKKLRDRGYTPRRIWVLYYRCGESFYYMRTAIEALE